MIEIAVGIILAFVVICVIAFVVAVGAGAYASRPHPTRKQMNEAIKRYGMSDAELRAKRSRRLGRPAAD
jgi:hypothetical protein